MKKEYVKPTTEVVILKLAGGVLEQTAGPNVVSRPSEKNEIVFSKGGSFSDEDDSETEGWSPVGYQAWDN